MTEDRKNSADASRENPAGNRITSLFSDHERAVRATMKLLRKPYFRTKRDREILDGLKSLLDPDPDIEDEEAPLALCVTAPSQAGKSRSLKRNIMHSSALGFEDYGKPTCRIARTIAPSPCTLKALGQKVLVDTGMPLISERRSEHYTWALVRDHLPRISVIALHIDEMQNATENATKTETRKIFGMLKTFMVSPRDRIALILSGTPDLDAFLRRDTQIRSRTHFIKLRPLSFDRESDRNNVRNAINELAKLAGIGFDEDGDVLPRLMHAALYQFGFSIKMSRFAIERALILKDSTLTIQHFALDYARRTGNAPPLNPFMSPKWREIDCTSVHDGWDED